MSFWLAPHSARTSRSILLLQNGTFSWRPLNPDCKQTFCCWAKVKVMLFCLCLFLGHSCFRLIEHVSKSETFRSSWQKRSNGRQQNTLTFQQHFYFQSSFDSGYVDLATDWSEHLRSPVSFCSSCVHRLFVLSFFPLRDAGSMFSKPRSLNSPGCRPTATALPHLEE